MKLYIEWFKRLYNKIKWWFYYRKQMKKIKKDDPFIY